VEQAIRSGQCSDFKKDWTNIRPPQPAIFTPDYYYKRPLAVFIPHLIIPNYIPACPICKKSANVMVERYQFVQNSKPLFGLQEQRELLTVKYPCTRCADGKEHWFVGYHKESLRLGGPQLLGVFRFFVAPTFAIDEPLHSYLVSQPYIPTFQLAETLASMAEKKFANDALEYYTRAARGETRYEKNGAKVAIGDNSQLRVTNFMVPVTTAPGVVAAPSELAAAKRKVNRAECTLIALQRQLAKAKAISEDPVYLNDYVKEKKRNKNTTARSIGSLGIKKIEELSSFDFVSLREFLDAWVQHARGKTHPKLSELIAARSRMLKKQKEDPSGLFDEWAKEVKKYFATLQQDCESVEHKITQTQQELTDAKEEYNAICSVEAMEEAEEVDTIGETAIVSTGDAVAARAIPFSTMYDKEGYNAKILSAGRIESIQRTYFLDRKEFMEAAMLQQTGRVLSLDFFYPLAKRIWVTKNDGSRERFQPYKCIGDIKNEHGQIVWFGVLPNSESVTAIAPHLKNLRERFIYRGANKYVVIYVDNCCSVRNKIKEAWPEALVLLDPWHWLKRWRDILRDPNTEDGRLFLALMSRAVLVHDERMVENKRKELSEKLGRPVTLTETIRQLPTVAPIKETMEHNVVSVLHWFQIRDVQTEEQLATWADDDDASTKPVLILKDERYRRPIIRNQLRHVREGCLTDPNMQGDPNFEDVVMYRTVENRHFCCRGSSLNERYHLAVERDVINSRTTMGPAMAERLHWVRNTDWNKKANETRNGATKCHSREVELLALVNSLAEQANVETLPFPDISMPRKDPNAPAESLGYYLGLGLSSPAVSAEDGFQIVEVVDDSPDSESENETTANQSETTEAAENATEIDITPELAEKALTTMAEILHYRRTSTRPESTMDAFERQSGGNPWIPFSRDLQTTNAVEKEEHRIFDETSPQYERKAALTSTKGYSRFQQWWQQEVAKRWRQSVEDDVIQIRQKSVTQLQEHYDYLQQIARQANQSTGDDETENARRQMSRTLYHSRQAAEGRVTTIPATPIVYPTVVPGTSQFVPIGAAMMQPQIFADTLSMAQARAAFNINAAPWIMLQPQLQHIGPPSPKRARVQRNWRKLCRFCGWAKQDHTRVAGRYQYNDNCALTICGICNRRKGEHDLRASDNGEPTGPRYNYMGKNCIFSN
jgi:hypothetical protein